MSEKEIIAYAITHAGRTPEGKAIKGGPYESWGGDAGEPCRALADAFRIEHRDMAEEVAADARNAGAKHARVIRIVRARPSEASATLETARRRLAAVAESMTEHAYQEMASALEVDACRVGPREASAVEVLRELVASHDAYLRADLRDAVMERDELRHHYDAAGPEHNLLALLDSYESDADTVHAQASEAHAMVVAAIGSVGAETIEAAVARLVADRGALLARAEKAEAAAKAGYARHLDTLTPIREAIGAPDNADTAVADRAREERPECLVAQAVAANVDIRVCEDDGGGFMVGVHESGCDEELARCVPAADVPSALARLLGEVSR